MVRSINTYERLSVPQRTRACDFLDKIYKIKSPDDISQQNRQAEETLFQADLCSTLRQGEDQKPHGDKGNMGKSFYINILNSKVGMFMNMNVGVSKQLIFSC